MAWREVDADGFPGIPDLEKRLELSKRGAPGNPLCDSSTCTRLNGLCIGYHCPYCGGPCGPQGHSCSQREYAEQSDSAITRVMPHAS